jgi:hypothetical protein
MEFTLQLYSQDYCPSGESSPFHAIVEESIWEEIHRDHEDAGRIFLRIFNEDGTKEWITPMGGVLHTKRSSSDEEHHNVYLPIWMLDSAGFQGQGEVLHCSVLTNDAFPEASKITLRVVDSAFYNADVKAELEAALTHLGILRNQTILQIPIQSLDNFQIELFVSALEPADCVLCDGDEVEVEFLEPVDHYEEPRPPTPRPPTPIPSPPTVLKDCMVPDDSPKPRSGFTAFQGEGRLLGGTLDNAPAWRKELGPPKRS